MYHAAACTKSLGTRRVQRRLLLPSSFNDGITSGKKLANSSLSIDDVANLRETRVYPSELKLKPEEEGKSFRLLELDNRTEYVRKSSRFQVFLLPHVTTFCTRRFARLIISRQVKSSTQRTKDYLQSRRAFYLTEERSAYSRALKS